MRSKLGESKKSLMIDYSVVYFFLSLLKFWHHKLLFIIYYVLVILFSFCFFPHLSDTYFRFAFFAQRMASFKILYSNSSQIHHLITCLIWINRHQVRYSVRVHINLLFHLFFFGWNFSFFLCGHWLRRTT